MNSNRKFYWIKSENTLIGKGNPQISFGGNAATLGLLPPDRGQLQDDFPNAEGSNGQRPRQGGSRRIEEKPMGLDQGVPTVRG
ncbi:MAG: hypothetical protein JXB25_12865 [Deltaproteobacteria bacterium]|nr:hypothetical protein [Deltaproteobacteria bacterium]